MSLSPEMSRYVDEMPDVYKHVLRAFPQAEPRRRRGDSLFVGTIVAAVNDASDKSNGLRYSVQQLQAVCATLARYRFLKKNLGRKSIVTPTEIGEEAIEQLTGVRATEALIPPLSPPPGYATSE